MADSPSTPLACYAQQCTAAAQTACWRGHSILIMPCCRLLALQKFGKTHTFVALARGNLAEAYEELGQSEEARALHATAYEDLIGEVQEREAKLEASKADGKDEVEQVGGVVAGWGSWTGGQCSGVVGVLRRLRRPPLAAVQQGAGARHAGF